MTAIAWGLMLAVLGPPAAVGQRVEGATLAEQVREQVQARTLAEGSRARVDVIGRIADQSLPAGALSIEVGQIAGRWPRARAGVPVRLNVEGQTPRTTTVWIAATDE